MGKTKTTKTRIISIPDGEDQFDLDDTENTLTEATEAGFSIVGIVPANGHRCALVILSTEDMDAELPQAGESGETAGA